MGEFLAKIGKIKGLGWLIAALAAGILLLFLSGKSGAEPAGSRPSKSLTSTDGDSISDYVSDLERQISSLLSKMDGVSNVTVMLTLDRSGQSLLAQDSNFASGNISSEKTVTSGGNVVEIGESFPTVRGIAVVCAGGGDPVIQSRIISLLSSLFAIPSSHICVTG